MHNGGTLAFHSDIYTVFWKGPASPGRERGNRTYTTGSQSQASKGWAIWTLVISHRYQEEEDTPPIKHFPHLFQTDASGCPRLEIKSKLISKSSRLHCVDRYPCRKLCENILADHQSCGLPCSSTLCDARVHVLALVQVDHLALVKKIGVKTEKAKLPG